MIDEIITIELIKSIEYEMRVFANKYYSNGVNTEHIVRDLKALKLLKEEVIKDVDDINVRVLRAFCDISALAVKVYDNTPLEKAISNLHGYFFDNLPFYRDLAPLGLDFRKENPI